MKTENEDKIISDFFNTHKEMIEDNGFSRRVVNMLPKQRSNIWLRSVLIFTAIFTGTLLVSLNMTNLMKELISLDLTHIVIFVICFGIALSSIISAANNSVESPNWA